jgi:hypothetical protein
MQADILLCGMENPVAFEKFNAFFPFSRKSKFALIPIIVYIPLCTAQCGV